MFLKQTPTLKKNLIRILAYYTKLQRRNAWQKSHRLWSWKVESEYPPSLRTHLSFLSVLDLGGGGPWNSALQNARDHRSLALWHVPSPLLSSPNNSRVFLNLCMSRLYSFRWQMFKDFATSFWILFGKDSQIIHLETTDVGQQSLKSVQASPVIRRFLNVFFEILLILLHWRPPLWSSGQRSLVRFPELPYFLKSSGSRTGSTEPREDNCVISRNW
jgi:hypothetical protein